MSNKTYGSLIDYVKKTLDLQEEIFITPDEFLLYTEEAIKLCESEVHKLNIEDQYFVACEPLALTTGRAEFALPSNVYGNKILRIVYNDGNKIYELVRIRNQRRFEYSASVDNNGSTATDYAYMLVNNSISSGTRIRLYPKARESVRTASLASSTVVANSRTVTVSSTADVLEGDFISGTGIPPGSRVESVDDATTLTMTYEATASGTVTLSFTEPRVLVWYIREAEVPASTSDVIDFPEFWNFIAQHVIVQCLLKEVGNPRLQAEATKLEKIREQVFSTLANQTPDQNDKLEADMSHYIDSDVSEGYLS